MTKEPWNARLQGIGTGLLILLVAVAMGLQFVLFEGDTPTALGRAVLALW